MLDSQTQRPPRPRRRSHLGPVGWLLVLMIGGYLLIAFTFEWLIYGPGGGFPFFFFFAFLAYNFVVYFIDFWIAVYLVVELQLWRRMRNPGHLLQFLGALLVLVPISWTFITALFPNVYVLFSPAGLVLVLLEFVSLAAGVAMALYGYSHRAYHANDVDLYRNVVVRTGENIGLLTDGYSTRIYETRYEGFREDIVRGRADEYATRFQRAGFYLFHRTDATGITIYPVTYTGAGGLHLIQAFTHLYRLWRRPERLTWVRIDWTGAVRVHVSPADYARIKRPVAHHALCAGVADAVVGSLLAYVGGQEASAVQSLLGPAAPRRPEDLRLPTPRPGRAEWAAVAVAVAIIVAGIGTAVSVGLTGFSQPAFAIQDVYWTPTSPVGGEPIYVFANLTGLGYGPGFLDSFGVTIWAYYNESVFGARYLNNIEGDHYGAWLGTYPNGTEVTFILQASAMIVTGTVFVASPPYVLDVGTVNRGGSSGLSIAGPSLRVNAFGGGTFGAWINSSAPIDTAQVLMAGYYTYSGTSGSGSGGVGIAGINLTAAGGGSYTLRVPADSFGPLDSQHVHAVIWYEFVARDTTWNTAATSVLTYEVTS